MIGSCHFSDYAISESNLKNEKEINKIICRNVINNKKENIINQWAIKTSHEA